jgi:hypothetical protein
VPAYVFSGDGSGVCNVFLLLKSLGKVVGLFSWPPTFLKGRSGLDWVTFLFKDGAVISCKACLAEVDWNLPCDRGVKNLLNFLGVIEGFRRSFLPPGPYVDDLRGESCARVSDKGSS